MLFKSSRSLLCFFLVFIMVIGIDMFAAPTLVRSTLCSQSYMSLFLETKSIKNYCNNSYKDRMALLAENSGIPIRVFDVAENMEGYSENAIERFYNGYNTEIFTQDKIDTYEKLIIEYLDGNNISYNKEQVHNTAIKAAEIYSDCYGLKNTETFKMFVDNVNSSYGRIASIGLVIALAALLMILILHNDKKKTVKYYTGAFSAAGLSFIFIGVFCLIFKIGKSAQITPDIYSNAVFNAISVMFVLLILTGIIITAVSTIAAMKNSKLLNKKSRK